MLGGHPLFAVRGSAFAAGNQQIAHSKQLKEIYTAEIGVREATGNNDGPRIAEYLRYCGLDEGYEWCAAFVSWCHGQAGYAQPRNPWSPALFPENRIVRAPHVPRSGDIFGIYYPSLGRIGHVGFVDGWRGRHIITVEGNVENAVVRKRRPLSTIHQIANWTDTP